MGKALELFSTQRQSNFDLPSSNDIIPEVDPYRASNDTDNRYRSGEFFVTGTSAGGTALESFRYHPPVTTVTRPLTVLDYITDIGKETLAGIVEGATLEHEQFGKIGPDTLPGDIARSIANVGGSIASYAGISAIVGLLGVGSGGTLPAVLAQAGTTAFVGRMLSKGDDDADMLDKVEDSLKAAGISLAIAGLPFAVGSISEKLAGGPTRYLNVIKSKMAQHMLKKGFTSDEVTRTINRFDSEVMARGGPRALHATLMKRIAKGKVDLAKWTKVQKEISTIGMGEKGLAMSREEFYKVNMANVGKFRTQDMTRRELDSLNKFYRSALRRYGQGVKQKLSYSKDMERYGAFKPLPTKTPYKASDIIGHKVFKPGYFSGHEPVERVMTRAGLGKEFETVYDAKVTAINEAAEYDRVRKALFKHVGKKQRSAIFHMMDNVEIPQDRYLGPDAHTRAVNMYKIYRANAKAFGVDEANVKAAVWVRRTSRDMLKRINMDRLRQGLEPFPERQAYVTHLVRDIRSLYDGGITPEMWRAIRHGNPGTRFRFGIPRTGNENVIDDVVKAHQAYIRASLKYLHLGGAARTVRSAMNNKYELVGSTKVHRLFSADMRKYVEDWLTHGVLEIPTGTDRAINNTLRFNARKLVSRLKMASYMGTMWGNPRSVVKNMTQQTLNIARLGKYWVEGLGSFSPKPFLGEKNGWAFAEKYCKLLQGRAPALEGMDPTAMGAFVRVGFSPFRLVDKANIVAGFNGGVKKYLAEGKSMAQAIRLADKLVRNTQFNYSNIDMPLRWLSAPGRLASQFQSWWSRWAEELWSWGGEMPYGDGTGRIVNFARHSFNAVKSREMTRYLAINAATLYALHKAGLGTGLVHSIVPTPFKSGGPFPSGLPPAFKGVLAIGKASYGTIIGDDNLQADGLRDIEYLAPRFIPGGSVITSINRISNKGLPASSMFFPLSDDEYDEWIGRR